MAFDKLKTTLITLFLILLFTLASILSINQYRFGIADQSVMTPFLKESINPDLYPNDYLIPQRFSYLTYLWDGLGFLVKHLNLSISTVFFLTYFISLYLTFLAIYLIAIALFKKKEVGFLSLYFLLFSKATLAGAATLENILLARTVALPILLFSIHSFFKERLVISFLLTGIGFLIHPLSASFVTVGFFVSAFLNLKNIGLKRFLKGLAVLFIFSSPIFAWKISQAVALNNFFNADPQWIKILRLRLPHHLFPFSWKGDSFFTALLTLLTFLLTLKHKPQKRLQRLVLGFILGILITCFSGIVFSEFLPLPIVLNLQALRSFKFILYLGMIYFANYFWTELKQKKIFFDQLSVILLSIGIFYGATGWKYAYFSFIVLALFLIFYHSVFRKELSMKSFLFLLISVVLALSISAYFKKGNFSIANAQGEKWLDVQKWAKENTDLKDSFIVPYYTEGFRVDGERAIYGDWKDGCLAVFNVKFAKEWFNRMRNLGFSKGLSFQEGFKSLDESDFLKIKKEMTKDDDQKVFLVTEKERKKLNFPLVFQNEEFIVYGIF